MIQYRYAAQERLPLEPMPVLTRTRAAERAIKKTLPPTLMEFFAGIGLVRQAFEEEGWTVELANDIDESKQELYALNFGTSDFIRADINDLKPADLPTVTLATSSFPCTDLSLAGARKGLKGEQSGAVVPFLSLLKRLDSKTESRRPPLVLLENVLGLLSSNDGADFRYLIRQLNDLGYDCDAVIVNAVHFVPQSRPRLFIFGVNKNLISPYSTMTEIPAPSEHRPEALIAALRRNNDLSWRFHQELESLPVPPNDLSSRLDRSLPDTAWWNAARTKAFIAQLSPLHLRLVETLKAKERYSYGTAYRRMRPAGLRMEVRFDGVAGCLRTPRGGSSRQIVVRCGKGTVQVRHMTPREYARLQGADDYILGATPGDSLFGFGDAVCVPAVRWVARNFASPFTRDDR